MREVLVIDFRRFACFLRREPAGRPDGWVWALTAQHAAEAFADLCGVMAGEIEAVAG